MVLLERQPLLTALDEYVGAAACGTGSVVLLLGEAGVGKTSLARAFCGRHEGDAQIWWGACDALSTPRPLGPLYDIARVAGGDLAPLMASSASRHERFSGFLDALVSPLRPVIAVVEDIHWADEATRDLLVYLARRVADTNAVLVATYRDDEVGAGHPLRSVLGSLATLPAVRRLTLSRLSEAAVAELAAGREVDPARIYQVTGGNPFFVTEVLATGGATEVPTTVSDAVLARAAGLSAAARGALEAAAVVPDGAEVGLVLAASGRAPEAVDECEQAGLLHTMGQSVRFRHELARLAVEDGIAAVHVPDLHARVLAQLAERSDADPARLAYHADRAGDRDAVLAYAPAAAERASRLGAHRAAVAHLACALQYGDALAPRERAELLERYGEECDAAGSAEETTEASGRALAIWRELGDLDRAGRIMAIRGGYLWSAGRNEEAHRAVRAAVALLESRPESPALAAAHTCAARLHMLARDIPAAIQVGVRAIELAERYGEKALLARALNAVGSTQWFADPDQAEGTLQRSLDAARLAGDDVAVGSAMVNLGSGSGEVRRYHIADRWLRETIDWCARRDIDGNRDYALAWLARSHFEQGRWSEAGATASEVVASSAFVARMVALTVLGRLRVRRGDPDADPPLAEAWEMATRTGDLQRLWPVAAGRAEAAWLAGHPEHIPALVEETYRLAVRLGQRWPIGELAYWLWRAGAVAAPPDGAAEPYARQIAGDWRGAAAGWDRIGCPYEVALARADSDLAGDLRAALEAFAQLGARPVADLLAARLRKLGVRQLPRRPSRSTLANPSGLTDRELEVLALVAGGLTNAAIARALHIAPKTAGHHVSAILAKLGARSRHEATRTARGWGIGQADGEPARRI